jgi:hypothetical protein
MLSDRDIDTLLHYLDLGIQEEIKRICNVVATQAANGSPFTNEDVAVAKSMGIAL